MANELFLTAADTARMQAGGRSMSDKLSDAITAGTAGAVVSGLSAIYNTGVAAANVFGADLEEVQTAKVLGNIDQNWAAYYKENQSVIDTVGFIGGAFIPGGVAVKALNLARTGKNVGAVGRVLGFTQNQQAHYLEVALKEVAEKGGSVFGQMNRAKATAIAYGAADNVLQAAVFETAAAITMRQSPLLADESWTDISWDIVKSSLAGGVLGGAVEALWMGKAFKDAGKLVESVSRRYDSVATSPGLGFGDSVFELYDIARQLPRGVQELDRQLPFSFKINGETRTIQLDTGALLDRKLKETADKVWTQFQGKVTNAVATDSSVGAPLAQSLMEIIEEGNKGLRSRDEITQKLGDYLFALKKVESIGGSPFDLSKEIRYLTPSAKLAEGESAAKLFTMERQTPADSGFRVVGRIEDAKAGIQGIHFTSMKDAQEAGFDIFVKKSGEVMINPASSIFRKVAKEDDEFLRVIYNTHTKSTSYTAVPTIADVATGERKLLVSPTGVSAGQYVFGFKAGKFTPPESSIEASARHLWAASNDIPAGTLIDSGDIALLDKLAAAPRLLENQRLRVSIGGVERELDDAADVALLQLDAKIREMKRLLTPASEGAKPLVDDIREIAYRTNTTPQFVQSAIEHEFDMVKMANVAGRARDQMSYTQRENLVFSYSRAQQRAADSFESPMLAYNYRKQVAQQQADFAFASVLGQHSERWSDVTNKDLLGQADATGAGASFWGFSSPEFQDRLRLTMQHSGQATANTIRDRVADTVNRLTPAAEVLRTLRGTAGAELGAALTFVRRSSHLLTLDGNFLVDLSTHKRVMKLVAAGKQEEADAVQYSVRQKIGNEVRDFLKAHHDIHRRQLDDRIQLAGAHGQELNFDPDALYLPPIDTTKVPYFAFVRTVDGAMGGNSEVAMITARTADELATRVNDVKQDPRFQVITKSDSEAYHKAKGDYEYARSLNAPTVDPMLRKEGKLGDFLPNLDVEGVLSDFYNYHQRVESRIVRDAVSVKYGQLFTELKWLSDSFTGIATSKFQFLDKLYTRTVADPFADLMKLGLNVAKRSEFTLWHELNEFVDAVGTRAYRAVERGIVDAKAGRIDWIRANKMLEKYNLPAVFRDETMFLNAQSSGDRNLIRTAVGKANTAISTLALRFDWINAAVNVLAAPVLLGPQLSVLRRSVKNDPMLAGKLDELFSVAVPGQELRVPTVMKVISGGFADYWGPNKNALIERFTNLGTITPITTQFHAMMEDLAIGSIAGPTKFAQAADRLVEYGSKITGNTHSEELTRFVASAAAKRMTDPLVEAGKMSLREQDSWILQLVNQTQGNYVTSQRPIVFQGTVGAAIGLFQTYAFNMFQQMFKHVADRNTRQLLVMGGLQTSLFGMNGVPLFEAINTHLIGNANINEGHHDAYSAATQLAGKELGDWMMYGTLSAFPAFSEKSPSLYTRGDLNPRHITIIPTSPTQIPAFEASVRVVSTVLGIGNSVANGGDLSDALMHGLEHNGINRPLAGLAQVLKGSATTSSGSLIAAHNDLMSITTLGRILGAKPMDEALGLNAKFRLEAYKARDRERIEALGRPIKQKLENGGVLTEEEILEFGQRYAQSGGRAESYSAALQRWARDSNESILNTARRAHKTDEGQRLLEIMGTDPIVDYRMGAPAEDQQE